MTEDAKHKLMVLLEYWVKHNSEHGEEFRDWAQKAGDFGETAVRDGLMAAAEEMDRANESLGQALDRLKGLG